MIKMAIKPVFGEGRNQQPEEAKPYIEMGVKILHGLDIRLSPVGADQRTCTAEITSVIRR